MRVYPPTFKEPVSETRFGQTWVDPYQWLEKGDDPLVARWVDMERDYTRRYLVQLPGREAFEKRISELLYIPAIGVPVKAGSRYFYSRKSARQEKYVEVCREGLNGPERILLDPTMLSADGSVSIGVWVPSYDGRYVAYTLRSNNSDEATLYLLDVETGKTRERESIAGAKYASPSWRPDGSGFYYTWLPTDPKIAVKDRPGFAEIRFHQLGDEVTNDRMIYPATHDPKTFLSADVGEEGRWLVVTVSHGWAATDLYACDLKNEAKGWKPIVIGLQGPAQVTAWRDFFYVLAFDKEPHGAVYRVEAEAPERARWKPIVPASDSVITAAQVIGGHLALTLTKDAASAMELRDLDGSNRRVVALPGIGSCSGLSGRASEDEAFYEFQSFTVPMEIYRLSTAIGTTALWDKITVPVDPSRYRVSQVFYRSKDGTRVPMFVVERKDAKHDGTMPLVLTGYGGFASNEEPRFSASLYAWLEAGGAYAVANLRGGGEYGEEWHRAGMLHNKQNVFDDFIAAAEYLIREKYTSPEHLGILGGSNGGLLVGAAMTQRPELFRAVVCAVPLLDMLRYTYFGSGATWIEEYGDPEKADDFAALWAYSPYQRVMAGTHYPATLMLSADSDDRVDPMHARKMTAALQAAQAGPGPILLRVESHSGHGGADLVRSAVEQKADMYSFLSEQLGAGVP